METSPGFCFSCGAAADPVPERLVPMCSACATAGPHLAESEQRWTFRTREGVVLGPWARGAAVEALAQDRLGPTSQVSRPRGPWIELVEHPDFRAAFLPGTELAQRLARERLASRSRRAGAARGRRLRMAGALGLLALAGGVYVANRSWGVLVVPEHWVASAREAWASLSRAVGDQVEAARDEAGAAEVLARAAALPGEGMVEALAVAHPQVEGSAAWHLARARVGLWTGTRTALDEARTHAEQALVLAPRDVECNAALAEVYAALLPAEPELAAAAGQAVDRAWTLDPASPAAQRARGAVAMAGRSPEAAAQAVEGCAAADVGCAFVLARAHRDADALRAIGARTGSLLPVETARVQALLELDRPAEALALATELARRFPTEADPQCALAHAAAALGRWTSAREAAAAAARIDPGRLAERHLWGRLQARVFGRPAAALDELVAVSEHPAFAAYPAPAEVLEDAAAAALAASRPERALTLADAALALDPGAPMASVQKGFALVALGRTEEVEAVLRDADVAYLSGHAEANYRVAAARLLAAADHARLADTELEAALAADPGWPLAWAEAARLRLALGNVASAVEYLEKAPLKDQATSVARSQLDPAWVAPAPLHTLAEDLREQLATDARWGVRLPELVAVLAWLDRDPAATELLARAVEHDDRAVAAHAALAWTYHDLGEPGLTLRHAGLVVAARPDAALHHALAGWAAARLGREDGFESAFVSAQATGAGVPGVHQLRAEALAALGRDSEAAEEWAAVLALVPDHMAALAASGRLAAGAAASSE